MEKLNQFPTLNEKIFWLLAEKLRLGCQVCTCVSRQHFEKKNFVKKMSYFSLYFLYIDRCIFIFGQICSAGFSKLHSTWILKGSAATPITSLRSVTHVSVNPFLLARSLCSFTGSTPSCLSLIIILGFASGFFSSLFTNYSFPENSFLQLRIENLLETTFRPPHWIHQRISNK